MKRIAIIASSSVALASIAGPIAESNPVGIASRKMEIANEQWQASTNYLAGSNFVQMVEAATKFDDLKAALLAKAKSDADKEAKEDKAKAKK